jgi:hypothetical protein
VHYVLKKNKNDLNIKDFNYHLPISEKEMELKRIESLQPKKFSKYYLDKICTILSESNIKNNEKYFNRRKNLKRNIKNDKKDQKEFYITSKNFEEKNNDDNIYNDYILNEDREGFLTNNNIDEEREKLLYEKLRTRKKFYNKRSYTKKINNSFNKEKKHNISLSPNIIKNFDANLAKALENNKIEKLTENQIKNLNYISDLNLFDSIDILNKKTEKLKKIKNQKKNNYLNNINLFQYDSKKWEEKRKELNKNINEIMFNKFNTENHKYLNSMRKGIDKTHENAKKIENNLNKFFLDVDNFIEKQSEYIKENNPQSENESRTYSKNNITKRPKNTKEKSKMQ